MPFSCWFQNFTDNVAKLNSLSLRIVTFKKCRGIETNFHNLLIIKTDTIAERKNKQSTNFTNSLMMTVVRNRIHSHNCNNL